MAGGSADAWIAAEQFRALVCDPGFAGLNAQPRAAGAVHGTIGNRIQKVLEDANIKLASVASDVLGAPGRLML
jgi:hypothetical protein